MKIGIRIALLSFVGVVFALIPHADPDQQVSAAPVAEIAPVAPQTLPLPDRDSLLSVVGGSNTEAALTAPETVVSEVLGVTLADEPAEVTTTTSAAPVNSDAPVNSAQDESELATDTSDVAADATPTADEPPVDSDGATTELAAAELTLVPDADSQIGAVAVAPTESSTDEEQVVVAPVSPAAPATIPLPAAPVTVAAPVTLAPATTLAPTTTVAPTTTLPPTTLPPTTLPPTIQAQMLAQVNFDWQRAFPNWIVEFRGERSGVRGLTYPAEKRIEIFIRADDTVSSLLRVFTHELGHVVDVELNSNEDRQRWIEQRGLPDGTPWWPSSEAPDFATGAGDFAEAFAVLETGIATRSTVAAQPTAADLELLVELIRG